MFRAVEDGISWSGASSDNLARTGYDAATVFVITFTTHDRTK